MAPDRAWRRRIFITLLPVWAIGGFIGALLAGAPMGHAVVVSAFVVAVSLLMTWAIFRWSASWPA